MKLAYKPEFGVALILSVIILILGRYIGVMAALGFIILREAWAWYHSERTFAAVRAGSARAIAEFTAVLLIGQNLHAPAQVSIAAGLWLWQIWLLAAPRERWAALLTAGVGQALVLMVLFLASSLPGWHWSNWLVLGLLWPMSWLIAWQLMESQGERLASVLAAAWALATVEVSWVLLLWQVSYGLPGGFILIPQATIVMLSLGYCFTGIYLAHRRSQLSRARLAEYALIGLGLLILVLVGTHWNS